MDAILSSGRALQPLTTAKDFRIWLAGATRGECFTYFVGFLALGIDADGRQLPELARKESALVGQRALIAAERGLVHLLQRRLKENCFEYFAVARPQPGEPPFCLPTCGG